MTSGTFLGRFSTAKEWQLMLFGFLPGLNIKN